MGNPKIRVIGMVAALAATAACDRTSPSQPYVDPVPARTAKDRVTISGFAERKSTVRVTRDPEIGDELKDGMNNVILADETSGRFTLVLPLTLAAGVTETPNIFSITAEDAATHYSDAYTFTVVREVRHVEAITLSLEAASVSADVGKLLVHLQAHAAEPDLSLAGLTLTVKVKDNAAITPVVATLDAAGQALAVLTGLTVAGEGSVVVDADVAGTAGAAHAEAPFRVLPGAVATVDVKLVAGNGAPADALSVPAGTDLQLVLVIQDAEGNALPADAVTLATTAPGQFIGLDLLGVTKAGIYEVSAVAPDPSIKDSAALTVTPGPAARLEFMLSATTLLAGETLVAHAGVFDAFDNAITPAAALTLVSGMSAWHPGQADETSQAFANVLQGSVTQGQVQVRTAGAFTAVASADGLEDVSIPFTVKPGTASALSLTLDPQPLVAGQDLQVTTAVKDGFDNAVVQPVEVWTTAPGARVVGNVIQQVTRATEGSPFTVSALVKDTNVSASADLEVVAAPAARLVALAQPSTLKAGETLQLSAHVEDAFGNIRRAETPSFTPASLGADLLGADQSLAAASVTGGVATSSVQLRKAAAYTLHAAGASFTADLPVHVDAGEPDLSGFSFDLATPPLGGFLAGNPVGFTYSILDSFQNPTGLNPVVTINAVNALIMDNGDGTGSIQGVSRSGSYSVQARVPGTGLATQTETLALGANVNQGFNLTLSASLIAQGGSALAFLSDGLGNSLDASAVSFTVTPNTSVSVTGATLSFDVPGSYTVQACVSAQPTICDTEYLGVQGTVDVVPPTVSVSISYPTSGNSVPIGGRVSFNVTASDDRALSQITYVAQFGSGGSCLRPTTPAVVMLNAGTTSAVVPFTFTVPSCALPLDTISIVAQAKDEAGNTRNSNENVALKVASPYVLSSQSGFVTTLLASNSSGSQRLSTPKDAAVEGSSGRVLVSDSGNDRATAIYADRTIDWLRDSQNNTLQFSSLPNGVAHDPARNRTLFAMSGSNRVTSLDGAGNLTDFLTGLTGQPAGLAVQDNTLCVAIPVLGRVNCYDISGATPVSLFTITDLANLQGGNYLAFDGAANLWVSVTSTRKLRLYNGATGAYANKELATGANEPADLLVAPVTHNILLVDRNNANGGGRLLRIPQDGSASSVIASGFGTPNGVGFYGNSVMVVDEGRNNVPSAVFLVSPDPNASPQAQF